MLSHRLLYIQDEIYKSDGQVKDDMNTSLAKHIAIAENMPIESNGQPTRFPELSAVKPNIRDIETPEGVMRRHWFMLPTLTNRHTPQLCISRVNHNNARCCLIIEKDIVVDANFSTLWLVAGSTQQIYAMFALMNSTWTQSYLETIATVMGGGALKVEASHIRKLLFPLPTDKLIASLSFLGECLAEGQPSESSNIISKIDREVLHSLLGSSATHEKCITLQGYLLSKVNIRRRK